MSLRPGLEPLAVCCPVRYKDGSACGAGPGDYCWFWGFTGPVELASFHQKRIDAAAAGEIGNSLCPVDDDGKKDRNRGWRTS